MEGNEELRETLVGMRQELDSLRTEAAHATLLLQALDTLLVVKENDDPFTGVFGALLPVFEASHAIVLVQAEEGSDELECTASSHPALLSLRCKADALLTKVLGGRIVTTLTDSALPDWLLDTSDDLSKSQPALYLPLGVRDRRGMLVLLRRPDQDGFDRAHVALARKFSLLASHAMAASRAHQTEAESHRLKHLTDQLTQSQSALAHRVNHDQLTGLANRAYVQELVDKRLSTKKDGERLALAFIDLDDFKRVNDFYGHAVGDALLCGVAERIQSQLRMTDILGRISGDEFVLVLDPFVERREISVLVNRVRDLLKKPFAIEGLSVKCSGSVGVAIFPTHGRDYETLRRNADAAMYSTKSTAKGNVTYFSKAMGQQMDERMSLEERLRNGFAERQFRCVLQAKVDMGTRRVVGFETLARWVDSEGVVHPPATFLQPAGELGLLDGITGMLLDELIQKLPTLNKTFGRDMRYSVNVSAAQASRPGFMRSIVRQVQSSGSAGNFMLELTEESLITASVFQTQTLPMMREAGVGISIDDFGTGYSSLSTLADITADELKIDRSFISSIHLRPRSQSILRAIESLGAALGIYLVAEGVETEEELHFLQDNTAITLGQGYLFHRPEFIDDLVANSGLGVHAA
ncbi:diguanylate cyclase [Devosia epidermidihirudinis]|uniref:Diguanylate cyclase n=1 Tax=Devosia epidermidihirudinis TaxID=1293439 RepID=A0A0F5Q8G7_9HYPH|nr:EAL domain-containing protein [Devosia epidermidihirudinis]KKC37262.1 diguanylate cyclase [Devosia epidermidihirudinis]